MAYKAADDRTDSGPVLVTFVQTVHSKGEAFQKRPPHSQDALSLSMMRRCVPFSQLAAAIELCHTGREQQGHLGQDATWLNVNCMFSGINRALVRELVQRCSVCQTKQPRKHKAPLTPLVSRTQWERVVMDLVDMCEGSRSRGYRSTT